MNAAGDSASDPDIGPWAATALPGVLRRSLTAHADERGSFTELWRASLTPAEAGQFVQANLSRSRKGVLRGLHFHRRQSDLWIVAEGRAFVGLADLRGADPESGGERVRGADPRDATVATTALQMSVGDALLIPRLVAHGFYAMEDLALIYLVSNEFDGTDELGFAWDDPLAAIAWPDPTPVLSERDRANPPLAEVLATLRG